MIFSSSEYSAKVTGSANFEKLEVMSDTCSSTFSTEKPNKQSFERFNPENISPPFCVMGHNHVIAWPKNFPVIAIPFVTPYGPFEVDVCFK